MHRTIRVKLDSSVDRSYIVALESGLLDRLPEAIFRGWKGRDVFIITDSTVRRLYGRKLLRELTQAGMNALLLDFPAGEESKNAGVVFALHTQMLLHGVRRDSLIVALGGGVVGDIAGYVAATVLRGVRYVQVPTTLLAQVDSSVGGKVGVDHPVGKNLIGAFYQPAAVFVDPRVLQTLPAHEFRNGLAEIVKIAAALDSKFFGQIERSARRIGRDNVRLLADIIAHAVRLKASVVQKDEFESGLRKMLNLGHTIGHAIEASTGYAIRHGAAVSMGLVAESKIAAAMGLLDERELARLIAVLRALKLPTSFPAVSNKAKFLAALAADKKSVGGFTQFVLLKGIGDALIGVDVPSPFITALITK